MVQTVEMRVCVASEDGGPTWVRTTDGETYWALWDGLPPTPLFREVAGVAPIQLQGEIQGRRVYGERLPPGRPLSQCVLPHHLETQVMEQLRQILGVLHRVPSVFGLLHRAHIYLTTDGAVLLVGRGRVPGLATQDLESMERLFERTETQESLDTVGVEDPDEPRELNTLAAWLMQNGGAMQSAETSLSIALGTYGPEGLDEIIPDLGTDSGEGIMEHWTRSDSGWENTVERTDVGILNADHQLLVELWSRMTVGLGEAPPDNRFDANGGLPSKGIRTLIQNEWPIALPMAFRVDVGGMGDVSTVREPEPNRNRWFPLSGSVGALVVVAVIALFMALVLALVIGWFFFL